jgi:opacity protein-like surface antigen
MNKVLLAAVASATLSTSAFAQEATQTGFYGQLDAGLGSLSDLPVTVLDVDGAGTDIGTKLGTANAFEFGGALGYDFGMVRAEVEVAYARSRSNSVTLTSVNGGAVPANTLADALAEGIVTDVIDLTDASNLQVSGNTVTFGNGDRLRRLSVMANAWFDIPVSASFVPYVGGGLGIQGTEIAGEGKGTFAWQLGAGVAVPLSSSFALTADYRHREQKGYTLSDAGFDYARVGTAKSNSFMVGLRAYF